MTPQTELFLILPGGARQEWPIAEEGWQAAIQTLDNAPLIEATFTAPQQAHAGPANKNGTAGISGTPAFSCALRFDAEPWNDEAYILLPAGAYNGNRFPALRVPYSPRVPEELVRGKNTLPYITDVPRLGPDSPRLQLKSGDLAFPGFGFFNPSNGMAWFAWAAEPEETADWVWEVEQEPGSHCATFRILVPGVRQSPIYRLPMRQRPTPDSGWQPEPGARLQFRIRIEEWRCGGIPEFLDRVFSIRHRLETRHPLEPSLPFSAAFQLIEEHYNRDCWREDFGVFATDCVPTAPYTFQTGWCGGLIATYPLLAAASDGTKARALRNLETFFHHAPAPNGLFYGKLTPDGRWTADFVRDAARPYTHTWTLVRRQADALFYALRQIEFLERAEPDSLIPEAWESLLRRAAQAFVDIWRRNGQFGHFIHQETGEILIGGSTSGALVPAALINAWKRYGEPAFLETACEAAEFFAREFLARGFTTGGPGDALQNPDSESAAALVESYAELHAHTGDARWLEHGKTAAALTATWVMPYDYRFPESSEFGRLGIRTRGSVFANTQNKHSAPGICTHAGTGLFHLWRATRDRRLLDLLRTIAQFLPQTVSRPDRPIRAPDGRPMPSGWINERVNTSDWDENVGGVFYGSCWCEVSLLLTAIELPGVYVLLDTAEALAFDHIQARIENSTLMLSNPTRFPATVRLFLEQGQPRDPFWFLEAPAAALQPGGVMRLPLPCSPQGPSPGQPDFFCI